MPSVALRRSLCEEARFLDEVRVAEERWFPSTRTFREGMRGIWSDWGCDSEIGTLRAVLMHRPGPEIRRMTDWEAFRFGMPRQ